MTAVTGLRTVSLEEGARIVREVNEMVVSALDILPADALPLFSVSSMFEQVYARTGPAFLERLELMERGEAVRKACYDVATKFTLERQFKLGLPASRIATAYFGVGECGEKTTLAQSKLLLANVPHVRLKCNNQAFDEENPELNASQDHEFNIVGITKAEFKELGTKHDYDVFKTLADCGNALIIDPVFRVACYAKDISQQAAFVNYLKFYHIDSFKELVGTPEDCVALGKTVLQEAQVIYEHIVKNKLIPQELSALREPVRAFMRKKKVEEMLAAMNRHFAQQGVVWQSNIAKRTILLEGDVSVANLAKEIQKYGVKCLCIPNKQTKGYTLMLSNTPMRELYHLEVRKALPSLELRIVTCITDYLPSPFKGLCMDRTFV